MPYIFVPSARREELLPAADERWNAVLDARPELRPAVELQRRLIDLVLGLNETIEGGRLPRLSLPAKYVAAKLARGVPALAGEPIPLPVAVLTSTLLNLCGELAASGAGEVAEHRSAIDGRSLDAGSLLSASLSAIRRPSAPGRYAASHPISCGWLRSLPSGRSPALQRAVFASAMRAQDPDRLDRQSARRSR
jgi:hypothetical protein